MKVGLLEPYSCLILTAYNLTAVKHAIQRSSIADKDGVYQHYLSAVEGKSNSDARDIAADILGERVFWDWDRTSIIMAF